MADGRNVFGFDVAFTPARPFKVSDVTQCDQISEGDGLWEIACGAAEEARTKQALEDANQRLFDDKQSDLLTEIGNIQGGIDAQVTAVSGCNNSGDDEAWYACVNQQIAKLESCWAKVTDPIAVLDPFGICMNDPGIRSGEARQALYDLRSIYMQYKAIRTQAENINERIQASEDANAIVTDWLAAAGAAETVARVAEAHLEMVSCMEPVSKDPIQALTAAAKDVACAASGAVNLAAQAAAGAISTAADVEIENAEYHKEVQNLLLDMSELVIEAYAADQHFYSKNDAYKSLLDALEEDVVEAQRQRAYAEHSPANDPGFRIVRDSSRMDLAKQMAKATQLAYLAARRAEYEYAARLSASNFRISDIYRARTAEDALNYLNELARITALLAGGASYETNPSDFTVSVAQHLLLLTDEALAKEGFSDPAAAQAERVRRFRAWVADNTVPNTFEPPYDGKPVLRFSFTTSLLDGGLFSQVIQQAYDRFWLLKLSGLGAPKPSNNGLSANLLTEQDGLSYQTVALTQGGLVHLGSFAGCTFDYRLIAPAVCWAWSGRKARIPKSQRPSGERTSTKGMPTPKTGSALQSSSGRSVSSTDWEMLVFAGAPEAGMADMDPGQLTDIELIFSTTYASRQPGEPQLSECTRIDW